MNYNIALIGVSLMVQVVKNPPAKAGNIRYLGLILGSGQSLGGGHGDHTSILAWGILWTEEPGGLQFLGSQSDTTEHARMTTTTALILDIQI